MKVEGLVRLVGIEFIQIEASRPIGSEDLYLRRQRTQSGGIIATIVCEAGFGARDSIATLTAHFQTKALGPAPEFRLVIEEASGILKQIAADCAPHLEGFTRSRLERSLEHRKVLSNEVVLFEVEDPRQGPDPDPVALILYCCERDNALQVNDGFGLFKTQFHTRNQIGPPTEVNGLALEFPVKPDGFLNILWASKFKFRDYHDLPPPFAASRALRTRSGVSGNSLRGTPRAL